MGPDQYIVIGLILAVLSLPALISAFADRRWPVAFVILAAAAGGLIWFAMDSNPGAYTLQTMPDVIARVVADLI